MRYGSLILLAALAPSACGSDGKGSGRVTPHDTPEDDASEPDSGFGGSAGSQNEDSGQSGAGSDAADAGRLQESDAGVLATCSADDFGLTDAGTEPNGGPVLAAPRRLVSGGAVPIGITSDGSLSYRENGKLSVLRIGAGATPVEITTLPGTASIKGRFLFQWSRIDYASGRADLLIWTGGRCIRVVGNTLSAEDSVAVQANGSHLLYPINVSDTAYDLVVASKDFAAQQVLEKGIGRASDSTCRAQYGFAGTRIVIASCARGSQEATLQVYSLTGDVWSKTPVSNVAAGNWTADEAGEHVFYTTTKSVGFHWNGGATPGQALDDNVTWGRLVPNGSAVLYAVGDQLRRTGLLDIVPIPIVTNKFRYLVGFSPNFDHALYSTTVTYEGGEKRDLLLTATTNFNPAPVKLVPTPAARLSRSAFSSDGKYALYLTDLDAQAAAMLHVRNISDGSERTFEKVDTVAAAAQSLLVFSDNRGNPTTYPILADLKVLDAASGSPPRVLRAAILDGRSFFITPDQKAVVYARPREGQDPTTDGIWIHPLD